MSSDEELMQRVCKGDHNAFAHLVRRHTDQYLRLALRTVQDHQTAEDIVQAAFVKLWEQPRQWNPHKSQFTTWFYRVILNACRDFQRRQSRTVVAKITDIESAMPEGESEQTRLEDKQLLSIRKNSLQHAIGQLPDSQRDALNLVVYCSLPQLQAAQVLGISLKALESLLSRARRTLRDELSPPAADVSASVRAV